VARGDNDIRPTTTAVPFASMASAASMGTVLRQQPKTESAWQMEEGNDRKTMSVQIRFGFSLVLVYCACPA
jgi:hypothetical protein